MVSRTGTLEPEGDGPSEEMGDMMNDQWLDKIEERQPQPVLDRPVGVVAEFEQDEVIRLIEMAANALREKVGRVTVVVRALPVRDWEGDGALRTQVSIDIGGRIFNASGWATDTEIGEPFDQEA